MLKRFICLLIVLLIFTLASCEKPFYPNEETGSGRQTTEIQPGSGYTPTDGLDGVFTPGMAPATDNGEIRGIYLYRLGETQFYRLNLATGNKTPVCSDPLCTHGEDCPFYGMTGSWTVSGDCVYFFIGSDNVTYDGTMRVVEKVRVFYRYDIKEMKCTKIYDVPDDGRNYRLLGVYDGQLYYIYLKMTEKPEKQSSEKEYIQTFCSCTPEKFGTEETVLYELSEDNIGNYNDVYMMDADNVYFTVAGEEGKLIRSDRSLTMFEALSFPYYYVMTAHSGDYCYYQKCGDEILGYWKSLDSKGNVILNEDGTERLTPYYGLYYTKRNLLTGEEMRLSDYVSGEATYPRMLNGLTRYYLYLNFEDGLWRCDLDGNKLKLVRSEEQKKNNPLGDYDFELIYDNKIITMKAEESVCFNMDTGEYSTVN